MTRRSKQSTTVSEQFDKQFLDNCQLLCLQVLRKILGEIFKITSGQVQDNFLNFNRLTHAGRTAIVRHTQIMRWFALNMAPMAFCIHGNASFRRCAIE